jgi:hypothetical protein
VNAEDVALGPGGTLYFDRDVPELKQFRLYRMSLATGKLLWSSLLAPEAGVGNTQLRVGPDGALYALVAPNMRWMPVATASGRPLSAAAQERGIGLQPVGHGLRLRLRVDTVAAPAHQLRVSLVDRRGVSVRSWQILSTTPVAFTGFFTPKLVGGDPVIVLDVQSGLGTSRVKWEYEVLRLSADGASVRFSIPRAVWGDNLFADLRVGPDGALYQLASSPTSGVSIRRYSLAVRSHLAPQREPHDQADRAAPRLPTCTGRRAL